jgi:hypothetical protein
MDSPVLKRISIRLFSGPDGFHFALQLWELDRQQKNKQYGRSRDCRDDTHSQRLSVGFDYWHTVSMYQPQIWS